MPRALVTGITGQDGLYLGELLVGQGYDVFGLVRDEHSESVARLRSILPSATLLTGDLLDAATVQAAVRASAPDEIYNLGGYSNAGESWKDVAEAAESTAVGTLTLLEAVREFASAGNERVRFYQASTSEIFGDPDEIPQRETTPFRPRSPYGVGKTFAHHLVVNYRERFGLFACAGIAYNHESERRGHQFVTRKITRAVARIALGKQSTVSLGDLDARRDWGYAGDYVRGMWLMLQHHRPDDYILATGETRAVRDILDTAFRHVGIDSWQPYVQQDPQFVRAPEKRQLVGDPTKAQTELGWHRAVDFESIIVRMVEADLHAERAQVSGSGTPD